MKVAKYQDLDKAMEMWFIQKRSLNEPIFGPLICEKAFEMNTKLGGPEDFKASSGWLHKFKSRHGIRELQIQGELLSADSSSAENFKQTFRLFVEKEGYFQDSVYNADERFNDCNYDDAVDWLATDVNDLGYQILDSDEIISLLQNEESENSSSDESMSKPKGPSSAGAFAAFETGIEWFEKQAEYCPTQLLLLKRLRDLAAEKRVATHRQMKIHNFVKKI
ncbi:uncharacterized protein LOC112600511 [Melanaphis sacchari]|uniref:uncharacterized protein LOC112600511 n=1 Tax=Melanaphis sacchari TaxID=742174 RepID=UPI000DC156A7|nr:uncharacterized protein LOC112600511 [Melanaphis sacchari]